MAPTTLHEVLTQVGSLTREEQLILLAKLADHIRAVSATHAPEQDSGKRSILALEGIGADLWHGVDTQLYIDSMRDEWDARS